MTYIKCEDFESYNLRDKIHDCPDGSSLFYAKKKSNGNSFIIRVSDEKNTALQTKRSNEKIALSQPGRLNPYVHPIYSQFSHDGKIYTVYKHIGHLFSSKDVGDEDDDEEGSAKSLIAQYFIYLRKASKLICYPVENSSIENMTFYDKKISMLGFDTVIPTENGSKEGISTDVITIAKNDIGLKSNYIKAASFMHYVFTGKSAITSSGLKILEDDIDNEDALNLIKECTRDMSSEQLNDFNPFKSEYLLHQPKIEVGDNHFKLDDLTFSWKRGMSISIGEVELSFGSGDSVTVKQDDNKIIFDSDGIKIRGEYEGISGGRINNVTIDGDGIRMNGEQGWFNLTESGLRTGTSTNGIHNAYNVLEINDNGLVFDGYGKEKLTIGENFEYSPAELFTVKFSPFSVNSNSISLSLSSTDLGINLCKETDLTINKKPSLNISSCGCLMSMNEVSPFSIAIGAAVVLQFTGSALQMTMSGVDISFDNGTLCVDNDVVAMSIGTDGPQFSTYGVPFDLKTYKDQLTFPTFEFPDLAQKIKKFLPKIPGLPKIPNPVGGALDIGGCCSIC